MIYSIHHLHDLLLSSAADIHIHYRMDHNEGDIISGNLKMKNDFFNINSKFSRKPNEYIFVLYTEQGSIQEIELHKT